MSMFHGTKINFANLSKFPTRSAFLDADEVKADEHKINNAKDVLFLPNDSNELMINNRYYLTLSGILPSGSKATVAIKNYPYFLVRVPDAYLKLDILDKQPPSDAHIKSTTFMNNLKTHLKSCNIHYSDDWDIVRYFKSSEFQIQKGFYIKLRFFTTKARVAAIKLISHNFNHNAPRIMGYVCETAVDDISCYYRVLCREYRINMTGWNVIKNYTHKKKGPTPFGEFNGDILFEIDIVDIVKYNGELTHQLKRDKSIEATWDIECNRYLNDGKLPDPLEDLDEVFMIGMTFHYYWDDAFLRVCITSKPTDTLPNDLTVQCENERELCIAFAHILGCMKPEWIIGFNDGEFDWAFVMEKAYKYKMLEYYKKTISSIYRPTYVRNDALAKYSGPHAQTLAQNDIILGTHHRYRNNRPATARQGYDFKHMFVKLDPETNADVYMFKLIGFIPIDARCLFRARMKNPEQSSLNFFLTVNNLSQKEDMPIVELFEIYQRMQIAIDAGDADAIRIESHNMARVKSYCITDAESCHKLMAKQNMIMDNRNISEIAYTSMEDAIYRADGMKVRNYVMSDAMYYNHTVYSNIAQGKDSNDKYPGAYVVKPTKGVQTSKLSIRELCNCAHKEMKNVAYYDSCLSLPLSAWKSLTDEDIVTLEDFIFNNYLTLVSSTDPAADVAGLGRLSEYLYTWLLIKTGRTVSGIDFASLYPNIIMGYNLTKEKLITKKPSPDTDDPDGSIQMEATAKRITDIGYTLHKIEFMYGAKAIVGYSVRHTYDPTDKDADPAECGFGIFPTILLKLRNQRKTVKKLMVSAGKIIEATDKKIGELKLKLDDVTDDDERAAIEQQIASISNDPEYKEVQFKHSYYASKQLAIKVFMNTFYGETGNKMSPLYTLELCGGVTSMGQINIKCVIEHVKKLGCEVVYGDTDSAYIKCKESIYWDIDRLYYSNRITKLEYWTKMVELTFPEIKRVNDSVNLMLEDFNKTKFLTTAYEEVLFPVAFLSKKKYYGIPHEDIINFQPKKLFIRGLEMKKRGVAEILKKICSEILWHSVSINECRSLYQIVVDSIDMIYSRKWDIHDFVKTGSYKPHKNNVSIHTFVRRMKERGIEIKPVERFKYVYIKRNPITYTLEGGTKRLQVGDMMELLDVAIKENLVVDLDKYVTGNILGQLARMVVYDKMFEYSSSSADENTLEDIYFKNAKSHIEQVCSKYTTTFTNHHATHKRIYKKVATTVEAALDSVPQILTGADINAAIKNLYDDMYEVEKHASYDYANYMLSHLLRRYDINHVRALYIGNNLIDNRLRFIETTIAKTKADFETLMRENEDICKIREKYIGNIITRFRSKLEGVDADIIDVDDVNDEIKEYTDHIKARKELFANLAKLTDTLYTYCRFKYQMYALKAKISITHNPTCVPDECNTNVDDICNASNLDYIQIM